MPAVFLHGTVLTGAEEEPRAVHLVCVDVSASGCRVVRPRAGLPVGTLLDLTFAPSDGAEVVRARVARAGCDASGRPELGLSFEVVTPLGRARVDAWLD